MVERVDISSEERKSNSFVEQLIEEDLANGKNGGRIQTRFPPEPNGYIHIGHRRMLLSTGGKRDGARKGAVPRIG